MNNQVKVVKHPETGEVVTKSTRNPEWGTFRVDSTQQVFSNGIFDIQKRTAFVRGKLSNLEALNLEHDQTLRGKIIKKESFAPFYEGQTPKINPTSGEEVLTNGMKTYLEYEFTPNVLAEDYWVEHTQEVSANAQEELQRQQVGG